MTEPRTGQPEGSRSPRTRSIRSIAPLHGASRPIPPLHDRLALGVFVLALLLRLAWAFYVQSLHPGEDWYVQGDAIEYTTVAENLLSGKGWWSPDAGGGPYFHGPIFPLFLAALRALGSSLFAVTLMNAFLGALTCWIVVRIARPMMAPAGALLAGLSMAVYPYFLHYTAQILTETLSVFLGVLLIAAFLRFSRAPSYAAAVTAGVLLGLATLNHGETYMAPPFLILWFLAFHPRRGRSLGALAALLLAFGLTLLPWHGYHALRNGKNIFLPPNLGAGGVLAQTTLEAKARIVGDPSYFEGTSERLSKEGIALEEEHGEAGGLLIAVGRVMGDLTSRPGEYLGFLGLKLKRMWGIAPERGTYDRPWIVIPTGALSVALYVGCLAGLLLYRPREEAALVFTFILIYTVPHLIFYAQPRYRLPVMPMVALMAGYAGGLALERLAARWPALSTLQTEHRRGRA